MLDRGYSLSQVTRSNDQKSILLMIFEAGYDHCIKGPLHQS